MILSSRLPGQMLALILLAAALALLVAMAAAPYLWKRSLEAGNARQRQEIALLTRQAGRGVEMRQEQQSLRGSDLMRKVLLGGHTAGIASANLQDLVVQYVNRSHITLKSIEALEPEEAGEQVRIGVRLSIEAGMVPLKDFLYAVEAGVPLLFVDEVSLRSRLPQQGNRGPVLIDGHLRISGYTTKSVGP